MGLSQKGQKWLDGTVKTVVIMAVIGMVVFLLAVHFVEQMFKDAIAESTKISQPDAKKNLKEQAPSQK